MRSRRLLGELLMEAGLVTAVQLEQALALQQARSGGVRLGQLLIEMGVISEDQLVETLSRQLQVTVAPEARLRQVRPPRQALRLVPADLARRKKILPIFFDERDQSLSLVMADPQDLESLRLIKEQNELTRLRVLIAGVRLLDELIAAHYGPAPVEPTEAPPAPPLSPFAEPEPPPAPPGPPLLLLEPDDYQAQALSSWLGLEGFTVHRARDGEGLDRLVERLPEAMVVARSGLAGPLERVIAAQPAARVRRLPDQKGLQEGTVSSSPFIDFYLKTVDFFLSLIEEERDGSSYRQLRQVSKLARSVAERLERPRAQQEAVAIAGYLCELGSYLTRRGTFGQAQGVAPHHLTADLWETFDPPLPVVPLLRELGEEPGNGAATGLEAGIVRAAQAYIERRDGSRTSPRLGHARALQHLRDNAGSWYPQAVVEAIEQLVASEQSAAGPEADGKASRDILLVDKDRVSLEVIELRFVKEGYRVRTALTGEEALRQVASMPPDLIVSEITLPRVDGFELCSRLKSSAATKEIPFFFLSARADAFHVTKGLELGAEDFLTKPVNLDILVAKVRRTERALETAREETAGVRGSLSELGLFDLLQVLQLGMKTARVSINRGRHRSDLFLDQGRLVYAALGELRGQEAFFELCTWDGGIFAVTPNVAAPAVNLHESNDFLLMEGMRRADELKAGILSEE